MVFLYSEGILLNCKRRGEQSLNERLVSLLKLCCQICKNHHIGLRRYYLLLSYGSLIRLSCVLTERKIVSLYRADFMAGEFLLIQTPTAQRTKQRHFFIWRQGNVLCCRSGLSRLLYTYSIVTIRTFL